LFGECVARAVRHYDLFCCHGRERGYLRVERVLEARGAESEHVRSSCDMDDQTEQACAEECLAEHLRNIPKNITPRRAIAFGAFHYNDGEARGTSPREH